MGTVFWSVFLARLRVRLRNFTAAAPELGTVFWAPIWARIPLPASQQAAAVWAWWNFAEARVPVEKTALRVNMDETSISLDQGGARGTIMRGCAAPAGALHVCAPRASTPRRRPCLTHIVFTCDVPEVQAALPQVIVGNWAAFRVRDWSRLTTACPPNVVLVRQKSAWNNADLCCRVITLLAKALAPHRRRFQPILLFDACKVHLHRKVVAACARASIWPVVVPAKLTWLLQPNDTHVFARYKEAIRRAVQRARAASLSGELDIGDFLQCVYDAMAATVEGCHWADAFLRCGYGQLQQGVSGALLQELGLAAAPDLQPRMPTHEELSLCLPMRARVPLRALLRPLCSSLGPASTPADAEAPPRFRRVAAAAARTSPPLLFPGASGRGPRTRSEHRAAAALAAALARGSASAL